MSTPRQPEQVYSIAAYGFPAFTPAETIAKLKAENCFDKNNRLCKWPTWLGGPEVWMAVEHKLLRIKFYRRLYGHTDYYLA